jgi:hypothetical protein
MLGNVSRYCGELLVNIYDLLIFPPLWVENLIRDKKQPTEIIVEEEVS